MEKYNKICEMGVDDIINTIMTPTSIPKNCTINNAIQPNDGVGEFGNSDNIKIEKSEDGGLEIQSKSIAIKLSSEIFDALKLFLQDKKGECDG